jgi:threonyl-tRNA synthetase
MNESLSYILAASLKELFPKTEINHVAATERCFFCDIQFPGDFEVAMLPLLEERMREWIGKKISFHVLTMMPSNAVQMLEHHGQRSLAQKMKQEVGEVVLLQLDRFFFQLQTAIPQTTNDTPYFKLVSFWPLKKGIRILGVGSSVKEELKEKAYLIKEAQNLQNLLEDERYISWIGEYLVWEPKAEALKAEIQKKIKEIYAGFDEVELPDVEARDQKKILTQWIQSRKRGGFLFQKKKIVSKECWDPSFALSDLGWGKAQDEAELNSYLHLITKFLTIFSFGYQKVGKGSGFEYNVKDPLGRHWTMSTLQWDKKQGLVQFSLCISLNRCIALMDKTMR